jgi:hypothetical protein
LASSVSRLTSHTSPRTIARLASVSCVATSHPPGRLYILSAAPLAHAGE